jgi:hypothetical protein
VRTGVDGTDAFELDDGSSGTANVAERAEDARRDDALSHDSFRLHHARAASHVAIASPDACTHIARSLKSSGMRTILFTCGGPLYRTAESLVTDLPRTSPGSLVFHR